MGGWLVNDVMPAADRSARTAVSSSLSTSKVIASPALNVTGSDRIAVDGEPLPGRERTRLFLYHKPRGLLTTHADPGGRPTIFSVLPGSLPRLISVGRLDLNTEGRRRRQCGPDDFTVAFGGLPWVKGTGVGHHIDGGGPCG